MSLSTEAVLDMQARMETQVIRWHAVWFHEGHAHTESMLRSSTHGPRAACTSHGVAAQMNRAAAGSMLVWRAQHCPTRCYSQGQD